MDAPVAECAQAEHGSLLLRQLERMRSAEELTDVVLLAEGIPFPCHKVVLSAFSPYFQVTLLPAHIGQYNVMQPVFCRMWMMPWDCHLWSRSIILMNPIGPGHVHMWSEGDPRGRGPSQGHSCSEPGAAAGLHVPSWTPTFQWQHPGSGCCCLPAPCRWSLQVRIDREFIIANLSGTCEAFTSGASRWFYSTCMSSVKNIWSETVWAV